jgi:hypothetical protein
VVLSKLPRFRFASKVKSVGFVLSLALRGPTPLASSPWHPAQFSMYSAWPLSASCASALPDRSHYKGRSAQCHPYRFPNRSHAQPFSDKDLQLPADLLPVFDSNQKTRGCA